MIMMAVTIYIYLQDTGPANQPMPTKTGQLYPKLNSIYTATDTLFSSLHIHFIFHSPDITYTLYQ